MTYLVIISEIVGLWIRNINFHYFGYIKNNPLCMPKGPLITKGLFVLIFYSWLFYSENHTLIMLQLMLPIIN
ncbi:hypothetical protein BK122_04865 [Paenibacillus pabuli]|nr:hypothetical protein BK122_04865 [Paenibacillus pabuli]PIH58668.1 hypothetical protein CS562_16245 [Paenibacillus sp. LK1]